MIFLRVFTTIGYGTFSPSSVAGRCIVMIPGAILIVMFAAVNANAGEFCLLIYYSGNLKTSNRLLNLNKVRFV